MFNTLIVKINRHAENFGSPFVLFGIYKLVNFLLIYPWWLVYTQQSVYPFWRLEIFSFLFALLLCLKKYWPKKLAVYYAAFGYFTIMWCQPFVNTFFFLNMDTYSTLLSLNFMVTIFILLLIVDWLSFTIILLVGVISATIVHYLLYGTAHISVQAIKDIATTFIWTIFIGIFFSRNASRYHLNLQLQKQLTAVRTVCASIAHELRTPLLSIKSGANGIKLFIPKLLAGYKAAAAANLDVPKIFPRQIEHIEQVIKNIDSEVNFSNTVIDTLLLNATQIAVNPQAYTHNSMSQCIKAALLRYPFNPSSQLELIHFNPEHDFIYHGDDLLITHVIFNLLKNALYAIAEKQKGEIFIWLTRGEKYNYLHFKDTAKGLTKNEQEQLFAPFQSNTPVGTGIGLSFCKMVMQNLGGDIELQTKIGDYAEFILEFPKIDSVATKMSQN